MSIGPTLWQALSTDTQGTVGLRLTSQPDEHVGLMVEFESGQVTGMALDRRDAQQLRHALTLWLVDSAPKVEST